MRKKKKKNTFPQRLTKRGTWEIISSTFNKNYFTNYVKYFKIEKTRRT